MEQQDKLFLYSLFQSFNFNILGLTYVILLKLDRTACMGWTLRYFLPWMSEEWQGLKSFSVFKVGLCCTVLFPGIPLFSRFGGTVTVISRLNLSGYFMQFPDYRHHMVATTTFSG